MIFFRTIVFILVVFFRSGKSFLKFARMISQINRGHLRKAGGYSGRNVAEKNNKDEDYSPKTLTDKNLIVVLLFCFSLFLFSFFLFELNVCKNVLMSI